MRGAACSPAGVSCASSAGGRSADGRSAPKAAVSDAAAVCMRGAGGGAARDAATSNFGRSICTCPVCLPLRISRRRCRLGSPARLYFSTDLNQPSTLKTSNVTLVPVCEMFMPRSRQSALRTMPRIPISCSAESMLWDARLSLIHVPDRSGPPVDPVAATTTAAEPSPARQPSHRADAAAPPTPTASGRDSASRSCPRSSNRPRGDASKGPFVARCGHAAAAAAVKLSDALTRSAWPDRPMRAIIASNTPAGAQLAPCPCPST
mmetsp:Transcript_39125/g.116379  ORF Transcript_39125/g.116379 Transcript_39125/m.116379 type:complete len:263 (-) Transcript_39125:127-915(-)